MPTGNSELTFDDTLLPALIATIDRAVAEVFSDRFDVAQKDGDPMDLVTSVDLAMQRRLEEALPSLLPGSRVVGEEGFETLATEGLVWLVDPLDGTVNFVAGLPSYAVAVALIIDGVTELAAVRDIPHGRTFSARRGGGAYLGNAPLAPTKHAARLAVLSSGLIKDLSQRAPDRLASFLSAFKLRNMGSQALHLCYAAAGHVSLVASREAKAWDDLAGALIAREAGMIYGHYGPGAPAPGDNQFSLCTTPDLFDRYAKDFAAAIPAAAAPHKDPIA